MTTGREPPRTKREAIKLGEVFGKLKVLGSAGKDGHGNRFWWCVCGCRGFDPARPVRCREDHLRSGKKKSCGCMHRLAPETVEPKSKGRKVGENEKFISHDVNDIPISTAENHPDGHQRGEVVPADLCEHGLPVDNPQVSTSKNCNLCKERAQKIATAMRELLNPNAPERDGKGKYVITGGNDSTAIEGIAAHCDERSIYEGREQKGTRSNRPGGFVGGSGGTNYGTRGRKQKIRNPLDQGAGPGDGSDSFDADPEHGYERTEEIAEE